MIFVGACQTVPGSLEGYCAASEAGVKALAAALSVTPDEGSASEGRSGDQAEGTQHVHATTEQLAPARKGSILSPWHDVSQDAEPQVKKPRSGFQRPLP